MTTPQNERPGSDDRYAWLSEGTVPRSREDRIAEALALIALLFSLSIGVIIALLPVPAQAWPDGDGLRAVVTVPAR